MIWLVVEPTPRKNMTSSIGRMKFPNGKTKNGPNHQPEGYTWRLWITILLQLRSSKHKMYHMVHTYPKDFYGRIAGFSCRSKSLYHLQFCHAQGV